MDTPRNRLLRKLRENQIRQKLEFEDSSKLALNYSTRLIPDGIAS